MKLLCQKNLQSFNSIVWNFKLGDISSMLSFFKDKRNRATKSQEDFFLTLYKKYYGYVKKISMDILNDADDAEDITQEVFVFINSKISEIRKYQEYQVQNYIHILTRGRSLNLLKEKQKRQKMEILFSENDEGYIICFDSEPAAEETFFQNLKIEELKGLMEEIPENYRNAFYLKYDLGYNDQEIAEIMGILQGSVRVYVNRAEKKLRELAQQRSKENVQ